MPKFHIAMYRNSVREKFRESPKGSSFYYRYKIKRRTCMKRKTDTKKGEIYGEIKKSDS